MQFKELKLIPPLVCAISQVGYPTATEIQCKAIPSVLNGNQRNLRDKQFRILNETSSKSLRLAIYYFSLLSSFNSIFKQITRKHSNNLLQDNFSSTDEMNAVLGKILYRFNFNILNKRIEKTKILQKLTTYFNQLQEQYKNIQREQSGLSDITGQNSEHIKELIDFKMSIKHAHCAN